MESHLVGLRAELHKKRVEASKQCGIQKGFTRKKEQKPGKSNSFNYQNAGVALRDIKDKLQEKEESRSEENIRSVLEKKAQLYDKLHGGIEALEDDNLNEKYLVNFQRKIVDEVKERKRVRESEDKIKAEQRETEELNSEDYKPKGKDEEWVEYTDVLGRTRECMRKDLPTMVAQDKNLLGEDKDEATQEEELISGEKHREKLREQWELEAEVNAFKKDVHYQDVMYNEARQHGTGYMKFSKDEKERKAQMDMLKEMHEEARRSEHTKKIVESKKQKLLKARLEKVRQRKRLKLGLPIKDDDKLKTPPVSEDEDEMIGPPVSSSQQDKGTSDIIKEETNLVENKHKVREWDIMKSRDGGFSSLSQEEWINRQRKERVDEFGPPTEYSYKKDPKESYSHRPFQNRPSTKGDSYEQNDQNRASGSEHRYEQVDTKQERNNEFAPPSTFEYYGPSSFSSYKKRYRHSYKAMEQAVSKGISNLRKMNDI
ncbi:coiled-coil domain-containing protein 174-like [Palaemon carinicauda]|uniref:coiled-coil domain-containing protein 174-like n=1 Tax=Palaemon carinicauda TaxID=392227 RepID=UPI0035B5A4A7